VAQEDLYGRGRDLRQHKGEAFACGGPNGAEQARLLIAAYSGDHDRLIQPKVITQSGDPDHLPGCEARQADGAAEQCGRQF
jgi:hypothetical protein